MGNLLFCKPSEPIELKKIIYIYYLLRYKEQENIQPTCHMRQHRKVANLLVDE